MLKLKLKYCGRRNDKNRQNMLDINVKRYNQFRGDLIYAWNTTCWRTCDWISHLLTRQHKIYIDLLFMCVCVRKYRSSDISHERRTLVNSVRQILRVAVNRNYRAIGGIFVLNFMGVKSGAAEYCLPWNQMEVFEPQTCGFVHTFHDALQR